MQSEKIQKFLNMIQIISNIISALTTMVVCMQTILVFVKYLKPKKQIGFVQKK